MHDIIVKSKKVDHLISDINRNSEKCVFEVPSNKLLGYIVCKRGIKVNLENTTTIMKMGLIKKLEGCPEVNRICMTVLNQFISRIGKRGALNKLLKNFDKL